MIRLEKLELFIPEYHTFPFEAAFRQENVFLPRVDFLVVGPYSDFVVPLCPNVTTIATSSLQWLHCKRSNEGELPSEHSLRLIEVLGGASKLTHLAMFEWWNVGLLEATLVAVPDLSSLSMECSSYHDRLMELLPILSRFNNLQYLALTSAFSLKVTNFQPPWCGNAYYGPNGDQLRQRVGEEREKATKLVVQMVFPVCRKLKVLWIGGRQRAEVRRTEEGDVAGITWTAGVRQNHCE
jgi:Leucine-rich repeat (LRR) protein